MAQPYGRVFNFSPGPCTLPVPVLEQVRDEMMNWNGTGMSLMEHSHRGKAFETLFMETRQNLAKLMGVPSGYTVLFLQGGASLQNTMIPLWLMGEGSADYIVTGTWGKKSEEAAKVAGRVNTIWDGKSCGYNTVPDLASLPYTTGAAYIHFTSNETIQGVEFKSDVELPAPSICDMSSSILSRPLDVSKYAMIYAGAQKNQGPAGVASVIIRDDLLEAQPAKRHPMLDYRLAADNDSMYNTPPTFPIYVCGLVYKWIEQLGGLAEMHRRNQEKAAILYQAIDSSGGFYKGHAETACRSLMNVTFTLPSEELTDRFVTEAQTHALDGLRGHRSVGGCRASIYNAFPREGCETLASFMAEFARTNG